MLHFHCREDKAGFEVWTGFFKKLRVEGKASVSEGVSEGAGAAVALNVAERRSQALAS